MKNNDRTNFLYIIAIIIMIFGCVLVVWESKKCDNAYEKMIKPFLEDKNLSYKCVTISVYANYKDEVPLETFDLIGCIPPQRPNLENLTINKSK